MAVPTAQAQVDQIDIAVNALMTGGAVSSYQIEGRALSRFSLTELRELRAYYASIVSSEQGGARNLATFPR